MITHCLIHIIIFNSLIHILIERSFVCIHPTLAGCRYSLCRFQKPLQKSLRISLIPKSFSFCIITPSFRVKLKFYSYITKNLQTVLLHHLSKKCAAAFKFLIQSFPPSLVASASFQNNSNNSFLDDTTSLRKRQYF